MKIALPRSPETQQRERLRNLRLGAAAITSTIQEACHRGRTEGMPNVALPLQQAEGIRQTAQSLCALAVQIDAHERGVRRASAHLLVLEFTAELAGFGLLGLAGGWQLAVGFLLVTAAGRIRTFRLHA